jgi:hypothetical protein
MADCSHCVNKRERARIRGKPLKKQHDPLVDSNRDGSCAATLRELAAAGTLPCSNQDVTGVTIAAAKQRQRHDGVIRES